MPPMPATTRFSVAEQNVTKGVSSIKDGRGGTIFGQSSEHGSPPSISTVTSPTTREMWNYRFVPVTRENKSAPQKKHEIQSAVRPVQFLFAAVAPCSRLPTGGADVPPPEQTQLAKPPATRPHASKKTASTVASSGGPAGGPAPAAGDVCGSGLQCSECQPRSILDSIRR